MPPTRQSFSVAVYDDDGVSRTSLLSLLSVLREKMSAVGININTPQPISSREIIGGALAAVDCFIMPGGADLPYCEKLNGDGNKKIKEFVFGGKLYIGICAGAYYAASRVAFNGDGYAIHGDRELALFGGQATGSIAEFTDGRYYDETTATKSMVNLTFTNRQTAPFYYHGGAYFCAASTDVDTFAVYDNGEVAAVSGSFGRGAYFLSGVHFELCEDVYRRLAIAEASQALQQQELTCQYFAREQQLFKLLKPRAYGSIFYKHIAELLLKTRAQQTKSSQSAVQNFPKTTEFTLKI